MDLSTGKHWEKCMKNLMHPELDLAPQHCTHCGVKQDVFNQKQYGYCFKSTITAESLIL